MPARPANIQRLADIFAPARADVTTRQTTIYHQLLGSTDPAQVALNRTPDCSSCTWCARGVPVYYSTNNLNAAKTVRPWDVWPGGVGGGFHRALRLDDGSGGACRVGRGGRGERGEDPRTRKSSGADVDADGCRPRSFRSTQQHVSGTLVAAGVNPSARGMS
jgi:hypothetical protein